jgi:hypothetical protein
VIREHDRVGRSFIAGAVLLVVGVGHLAPARADAKAVIDDEPVLSLDQVWPEVPSDHSVSLEDRITDHVTDWGNHVGNRMDQWSRHHARLRVDGRNRRAQLHLGGGNEHLMLDFDSSWLFTDGKAIVKAKFQVALEGHHFELELPNMDLSHDSYHGQGMVEVNVAVLEKRF